MKGARFGITVLFLFSLTCLYSQEPGTLKWVFETGDCIYSSPAISVDGTIYVGSFDYNLYAIYSNGTRKWIFEKGKIIRSSPSIGADGTIYVGTYDNNLYAINPGGTQKWVFETENIIWSSPAIGADGTIYVGSGDDNLYAINHDGTKRWAFSTGDWIYSSPAIGSDGTIYVGSNDGCLYAINPDGTQKWVFETDNDICSSPAIGQGGTIYVGSLDHYLYAISPDGTQKWAFETESVIYSSPAIGPDGTVYVGSLDHYLYAVNPDGTEKWAFNAGGGIVTSPAIGVDGIIYVGSNDNNIYAINPDGTEKWAFETEYDVQSSPAIGADGTIYVGSDDHCLYAIHSSSPGLADSPWPRFHQNNKNAGRYNNMSFPDIVSFHFIASGQSVQKDVIFNNPTDQSVTLNSCTMSSEAFSLISTLPIIVRPTSSELLTVFITPDSIDLYQSDCQITYEKNGNIGTLSGILQAGIFLEDQSEQNIIAKKVYDNYLICDQAEDATVAKMNNLGLLYRLLGEPDLAEMHIKSALSQELDAMGGYGGIKMNLGVVKSDQDSTEKAAIFYNTAWSDLIGSESTSALSPQISYNRSWEFYHQEQYDSAMVHVNRTLNHAKTNDWLMAKAYVLRGAIKVQNGLIAEGEADFSQAIIFDPEGPIGNIAGENLEQLTSVWEQDEQDYFPKEFTLLPNYPNPFNPETVIEFGLPEAGTVEAVVYNVLGEKVRTLTSEHYEAGWHRLTWQGADDAGRPAGSGIYLLKIRTGDKVLTGKMSLLR